MIAAILNAFNQKMARTKTRVTMLLRIASLLFQSILLISLLGGSNTYAQFDDPGELVLSPQEIARLRKLLDTVVQPDWLLMKKANLYRDQARAAQLLGDQKKHSEIMTTWLLVEPEGDAKWRSIDWHWNHGRRNEAFKTLEELIQSRTWPGDNVRMRSRLAFLKIQENDLAGAATQLDKAASIINYDYRNVRIMGMTGPYWLARGEIEFYLTRSELESAQGKWSRSIESAKLAVIKAKEALRFSNGAQHEDYRVGGRKEVLLALSQLAERQIQAGLYSDAEWTFRDTLNLAKEYGFNENFLVEVFDRISDLYLATGQFQAAMGFSQRGEVILRDQGVGQDSPRWLSNQRRIHYALAAQNKWTDLSQRFEILDDVIRKAPNVEKLIRQEDLRGFALIKRQRPNDALALLEPHLQSQIEQLGSNHYYTALTRGLYATALSQKGDAAQARRAFENALQHLGISTNSN